MKKPSRELYITSNVLQMKESYFVLIILNGFNALSMPTLQTVGTVLIARNPLVFIQEQDLLSCMLAVHWYGCQNYKQKVALSTMEAEYIVLSQAMRELIPLLGILEELTPVLHLNKDQPHVFWKSCSFDDNYNNLVADLYKDNAGAYELAKAPKTRCRTKHIALKYNHFREHVSNGTIKINLIGTKDPIANIFMKALDKPSFTHLRKLLCGW
jgi:hypothetical protein